jgi:hypothetical protein
MTEACGLPSPWLAHRWLPLLTQPVESSLNSISPGGPWSKRAKWCGRNDPSRQDHAQPHGLERLEGLVPPLQPLPHTPRGSHWLKWRWRGSATLLRTGTLATRHQGLKGRPECRTSHGSMYQRNILKLQACHVGLRNLTSAAFSITVEDATGMFVFSGLTS